MKNRPSWVLVNALVFLMTCSAQAQDSFDDLVIRAKAAQESSDASAAIPIYESALKIQPDWKQGLWLVGSLLYDVDRYSEATEYLSRLTALAGQSGQAWALLGLCEYETGHFNASLDHIERATKLGLLDQPQMTLVLLFHQAAVLTKLNRFDDAFAMYASFFNERISDQQVLLGLGLLSLRRALVPAEVKDAERDLCLSAGNAFAAMLANDRPKARRLYEELAARFPDDANVHYAFGYFLFGTDGDDAIAQWQRALTLDPTNLGAHIMLSWAFCLRGESVVALDQAKAALAQNPDEVVPKIVLGRELVDSGHLKDGLLQLERAVQLQPANLEANLALAGAYSEAGRKSDARKERERCVEIQSEKRRGQQQP